MPKTLWRTSNHVLEKLQHIFTWSTCWWRNRKALNTMVHPSTHKMKAHMELAQSGCVWDKLAPQWAGRIKKRKRCTSRMDMKDLGTFAARNVMHCVMNGQKVGEQVEADKETTEKGALLDRNSKVAETWLNWAPRIGKNQETC